MRFGNTIYMSRIGKQPIIIPDGVTVNVTGQTVSVKCPKGELSRAIHRDIAIAVSDKEITLVIARKSKQAPALWGTSRALLANMVTGVTVGFKKQLELHGVGYRAGLKGKDLELVVGFSHPVLIKAIEDVVFAVEKDVITIEGIKAELVGQIASNIRKVRPPEPYKGKGIRYVGENVRRKVGKVVGAAA